MIQSVLFVVRRAPAVHEGILELIQWPIRGAADSESPGDSDGSQGIEAIGVLKNAAFVRLGVSPREKL